MRKLKLFSIFGLVFLVAVIFGFTGCGLGPKTGVNYSYYYPDWTSDGKIICVKKAEGWTETTPWPFGAPMRSVTSTAYYITTMSEEGTQETNIKQINSLGKVAASPLGNYIAYTEGNYIKVITATGNNVSVIDTGADIENIDWAPDESRLVYGSNIDIETDRVVIINRDGTNKIDIVYGRTPSWMPTGEANKIVYSAQDSGRISFYNFMSTGTSEISANGFQFDWHINGEKIFYAYYGIWVINVDGANGQKLVSNSLSFPRISPDGIKLVCGNFSDTGIWIVNVDGSGLSQIK